MDPDEAERVGALFSDIAQSRTSFPVSRTPTTAKMGRKPSSETSGVPIFDGSSNLVGYRGIDRDITMRKQAEKTLLWKTTSRRARGVDG